MPGVRYLVVARTYSGDGAWWIGAHKTRPRPGMASTRGGRGGRFRVVNGGVAGNWRMWWAWDSPSNHGNLPLRFRRAAVSGRVCPEYDIWWLPARIPVTARGGSAHVKPAPSRHGVNPWRTGGRFRAINAVSRQLTYAVAAGFAVKPWKPAPTIHGAWGVKAGFRAVTARHARRYLCDGAWWIGARQNPPPRRGVVVGVKGRFRAINAVSPAIDVCG